MAVIINDIKRPQIKEGKQRSKLSLLLIFSIKSGSQCGSVDSVVILMLSLLTTAVYAVQIIKQMACFRPVVMTNKSKDL